MSYFTEQKFQTFQKLSHAHRFNFSDLDLPQNFDTCITIMSDYTAPKDMLDHGHKKASGRDICKCYLIFLKILYSNCFETLCSRPQIEQIWIK